MGNTPRKKGTYYDRTAEERRAYQNAYYQRKKHDIARAKQLEALLNPESFARKQATARARYVARREELLARKRERYAQSKAEEA